MNISAQSVFNCTYIFRYYSFCKVYHPSWRSRPKPQTRLIMQPLFQANIKGTKQDQHQWAFVKRIYRLQVDSFHKWPVMQKALPYRDHIMARGWYQSVHNETRVLSILRVKYYIKAQLCATCCVQNVPGSHISFNIWFWVHDKKP